MTVRTSKNVKNPDALRSFWTDRSHNQPYTRPFPTFLAHLPVNQTTSKSASLRNQINGRMWQMTHLIFSSWIMLVHAD